MKLLCSAVLLEVIQGARKRERRRECSSLGGRKKEEGEESDKKENVVPTHHPPGPGRDVVAELPFDGALRGFPCHYAVSKLHLMRSPEIRRLKTD